MTSTKKDTGVTGAQASATILKPLPPDAFVDFRGEISRPHPEDATRDLALNAEMRWESMADKGYLTPIDHFFVRSHAPTPHIEAAQWKLSVDGPGVERPLELGYEDLRRLPEITVTQALECAGNGRISFEEHHGRKPEGTPWRLGAIGVAEWTGVPLREVLELAGLKEAASEVMVESLDAVRMRRPLPVEKALARDTLLAFGMNGEVLPPDHGFPVRLMVPGWAAVASVKWVGNLHVSDGPLFSPWNTQKYVLTGGELGAERRPVTARGIKSAVELPWPASLKAGRLTVTGRSWSGGGSIAKVEYSLDGGGSWQVARLFGPNLPGAWARWSFGWDAAPGEYEIRAKATDEGGATQPDVVPWNDLGYLYDGVVAHPVEVR